MGIPIPTAALVFGHVARLDDVTPANMALQLHINASLNRPPVRTWRRPPGRPRNNWLDQLRNDSVFSCTVLFVGISQLIGCEDRLRNDL